MSKLVCDVCGAVMSEPSGVISDKFSGIDKLITIRVEVDDNSDVCEMCIRRKLGAMALPRQSGVNVGESPGGP